MEQWLEFWRDAGAWSPANLLTVALYCDARQLQRRWFAELSRAMDLYLRSPAFLALMSHTRNQETPR